jgi:hypothetical protein
MEERKHPRTAKDDMNSQGLMVCSTGSLSMRQSVLMAWTWLFIHREIGPICNSGPQQNTTAIFIKSWVIWSSAECYCYFQQGLGHLVLSRILLLLSGRAGSSGPQQNTTATFSKGWVKVSQTYLASLKVSRSLSKSSTMMLLGWATPLDSYTLAGHSLWVLTHMLHNALWARAFACAW